MIQSKKGQGLPLNTIVIAIIVIIVLLVIILFFTSSFSGQQQQIDDTGSNMCDPNNPVLRTQGYIYAEYSTHSQNPESECQHSAFEPISVIQRGPNGEICCATKEEGTWTN